VAATLEIVTADLHRRDELPSLLQARIGAGWPPPLVDVAAMQQLKHSLVTNPVPGGWTSWYWILRRPRTVIGLSGFKTKPVNGAVEIGYSLVPQLQRRGLAAEAIAAMVAWAFANGAELVFAETLPELVASQRVLLKNAFRCVGEGSEPGVIRFERRRS
jgi:RimJ/RimL family protein N-acetyltransferase